MLRGTLRWLNAQRPRRVEGACLRQVMRTEGACVLPFESDSARVARRALRGEAEQLATAHRKEMGEECEARTNLRYNENEIVA